MINHSGFFYGLIHKKKWTLTNRCIKCPHYLNPLPLTTKAIYPIKNGCPLTAWKNVWALNMTYATMKKISVFNLNLGLQCCGSNTTKMGKACIACIPKKCATRRSPPSIAQLKSQTPLASVGGAFTQCPPLLLR